MFTTSNIAKHAAFIPSNFHQILKWIFCTAANFEEIKETVWTLSGIINTEAVIEANGDETFLNCLQLFAFMTDRVLKIKEDTCAVSFLFDLLNMNMKLWKKKKEKSHQAYFNWIFSFE